MAPAARAADDVAANRARLAARPRDVGSITRTQVAGARVSFSDLADRVARADGLAVVREAGDILAVFDLPAGAVDRHLPHREDEVYYVVRGRAALNVEDQRPPVEPGGVFSVAAAVPHRFVDLTEDLTVLVVFARGGIAPPSQ